LEALVLHTSLCDLVGIEAPVIQAGMSVFTSPELVAAVSNAGGLGSLGAWQRPADRLDRDLAAISEQTDRPFAVNHVIPDLDDAAFALTLKAGPAVVSFALDDPRTLVDRVHDAGSLAMQQVTTVAQASEAAARGVDVIIAQGGEAGGYGGSVATLPLVPQVVDAVRPLPVVAAGGIADGRGLAAALMLGAAGVNVGSRFLASQEAPIPPVWKESIVEAASQDFVQVDFLNDVRPVPGAVGYGTRVRAFRSEFVDKWEQRRDDVRRNPEDVVSEMGAAMDEGRMHELVAGAGQSSGLVRDVLPAAEIVRTIVDEAERALRGAGKIIT
jgi:nitronate monooxygenase/enoyl-[acyl-carrier protein] reductase II